MAVTSKGDVRFTVLNGFIVLNSIDCQVQTGVLADASRAPLGVEPACHCCSSSTGVSHTEAAAKACCPLHRRCMSCTTDLLLQSTRQLWQPALLVPVGKVISIGVSTAVTASSTAADPHAYHMT
jgi:hypothetical protein